MKKEYKMLYNSTIWKIEILEVEKMVVLGIKLLTLL